MPGKKCSFIACIWMLSISLFSISRTSAVYAANPPVKANIEDVPQPILRTGTELNTVSLSPNAAQLADILGIRDLLQRVEQLRSDPHSKEFLEAKLEALQILQQTSLEVDFVRANCDDEVSVIREMLANAISRRDRKVAITNAASFITNGILWSICEGLGIPTYSKPKLSVPAGTVGILAGIVPSVGSTYAIKMAAGDKRKYIPSPNMLCQIFDLPTVPETSLPRVVWEYLTSVPPGDQSGIARRDQIIDRWIADDNIESFTDRNSKQQIAIVTGYSDKPLTVTIEVLLTRQTMLEQLCSEVFKMKRLLLELNMVVTGRKHL